MIQIRNNLYVNPDRVEALKLEAHGIFYSVDIYSAGGIVYRGETTTNREEAMSQLEQIVSQVDGAKPVDKTPAWYEHG